MLFTITQQSLVNVLLKFINFKMQYSSFAVLLYYKYDFHYFGNPEVGSYILMFLKR